MRGRSLPRVRNSGGWDGDEVPSVRREHDVFPRRSEQIAFAADADEFAGDVRNSYAELFDVRDEFALDSKSQRISAAERRRIHGDF